MAGAEGECDRWHYFPDLLFPVFLEQVVFFSLAHWDKDRMTFSPVQQADTLKERYQKIGDTKRNTPIEVLCENFPGMTEPPSLSFEA